MGEVAADTAAGIAELLVVIIVLPELISLRRSTRTRTSPLAKLTYNRSLATGYSERPKKRTPGAETAPGELCFTKCVAA